MVFITLILSKFILRRLNYKINTHKTDESDMIFLGGMHLQKMCLHKFNYYYSKLAEYTKRSGIP